MAEFGVPSHDKIAVTALNNVRTMTYTGIWPYREISIAAHELWAADGHTEQSELIEPRVFGPGMEARYRLGSMLAQGSTQVLEVGSGLAPRGLVMTSDNPDITYVELDLPVMATLKRRVLRRLVSQGVIETLSPSLHIEPGNVLDVQTVLDAAEHFNPDRPVTMFSEGLVHYLPHTEKAVMAHSMGTLLRKYGGVWYTDLPIQQGIEERDTHMVHTTAQQTGRNVEANRFADVADARVFFADNGLQMQGVHSFVQPSLLDSLTLPHALGVSREEVIAVNTPLALYAFSPSSRVMA